MRILLGSDHRGYELKERIGKWLGERYDVEDYGAKTYDKSDDYTTYAERVASVIGEHYSSGHVDHKKDVRGILFCGSGVGVDIVANKFDGVRASIGKSAKQIEAGRADDDMNVLVIAADFTSETEAKDMVSAFMKTKFLGKTRHKRRLEDIARVEKNN